MKILRFTTRNSKEMIEEAVKALKNGQILVCPTDTVYGLICDAGSKKAIKRLYKIKKRSKNKLLPIFVRDIKMAKKLYRINPSQEKFLKKHWPGAVTAVFKKGKPGLRMPDHKFVLDLIKRTGPLAETSANVSGKPASGKIKDILRQFKNQKEQPDLVLDAGNLKKSKPSKVVDLTLWPPRILRY